MPPRRSSTKGFKRTDALLTGQIRRTTESRGFAQSRLLTQWAEVAGETVAAIARPVEVSYGRAGMGATLTLLTTGANAPMLEMQKERLREKVNAIYGYNAIARVRITQTAATGFAEGQVEFDHRPKASGTRPSDPGLRRQAAAQAGSIDDGALRDALEKLGENILIKRKNR